jgi:hypothetical protein
MPEATCVMEDIVAAQVAPSRKKYDVPRILNRETQKCLISSFGTVE